MALKANDDHPDLSEENLRSTKKVRIRLDGAQEGGGDRKEAEDTEMAEKDTRASVSYKNKLLNQDRAGLAPPLRQEVVITDKDYHVSIDGDIPSIEFSKEIREVLVRGMERTVIIKLLGRSITYHVLLTKIQAMWHMKGSFHLIDMEGGFYMVTFDLAEDYTQVLTGGPWTIFEAYLTVQLWSVDFEPYAPISKVVAWLRIPGLSFRYYHKSTLRAIGTLLGEVIKIDYRTETRDRGKYARIAILLDLQKSLVPWIKVDGRTYGVEYEGLPTICFVCGKYGHLKERCKEKGQLRTKACEEESGDPPRDSESVHSGSKGPDATNDGKPASPPSPYGAWMQEDLSGRGRDMAGIEGKVDLAHVKEKASIGHPQAHRKAKHGTAHVTHVYRQKERKEVLHTGQIQKPGTAMATTIASTNVEPNAESNLLRDHLGLNQAHGGHAPAGSDGIGRH
ncbi:hypothetical protein K1719_009468 [Acacia pycnantha]|nr:hypothetical protein K1719_009468 [Acacia pycnantha]